MKTITGISYNNKFDFTKANSVQSLVAVPLHFIYKSHKKSQEYNKRSNHIVLSLNETKKKNVRVRLRAREKESKRCKN